MLPSYDISYVYMIIYSPIPNKPKKQSELTIYPFANITENEIQKDASLSQTQPMKISLMYGKCNLMQNRTKVGHEEKVSQNLSNVKGNCNTL